MPPQIHVPPEHQSGTLLGRVFVDVIKSPDEVIPVSGDS